MRRAILMAVFIAACSDEADEEVRRAACARAANAWSLESLGGDANALIRSQPRDLAASSKIAVAVYHFNVQYVAGGLSGFPDGEIVAKFDLNEAEVEDRIIREGLEPVLDLYLQHPSFGADIELQAYMVELIALRHPDVLEKMRTLASREQIDFDSFHYSDQLYVAYPRRDLEVSLDLVEEIFSRTGLVLGRSIFTQEGQFARGQIPLAGERGHQVSILPKNLFSYQLGDAMAAESVLYTEPDHPEHTVIIGGRSWSGTDSTGAPFELSWTFMDDGEIAYSKNSLNPYFGLDYEKDPAKLAERAVELESMEAAGFVHARIADAVDAMRTRGIAPRPLPAVLDGTWQPKDTNNLYRWMGGPGLFRTKESDSETLSAIWRARTAVEAIERRTDRGTRGARSAWREVLLAEVSDSTGWNPFKNEIVYSRSHAAAAHALAEDIRTCASLETEALVPLSCAPSSRTLSELGAELISPAREVTAAIEDCTLDGATLARITLTVPKLTDIEPTLDGSDQESMERELELRFAQPLRSFELAHALEDRTRTVHLDDYAFESIGIALPIGLIQLDTARFAIQELGSGRVGALISRTGEGAGFVRFKDMTVTRAEGSSRRYYVVENASAEEARVMAQRINGVSR